MLSRFVSPSAHVATPLSLHAVVHAAPVSEYWTSKSFGWALFVALAVIAISATETGDGNWNAIHCGIPALADQKVVASLSNALPATNVVNVELAVAVPPEPNAWSAPPTVARNSSAATSTPRVVEVCAVM